MRKTGFIAAALVAALPLMATVAHAQSDEGRGRSPAARSAPSGGGGAFRGGGGYRGGMVGGGGGAFRGGISAGPRIGIGPQAGWSGARPGWNGPRVYSRPYGSRYVAPGIGFGAGLLLGGALAAPYPSYAAPYPYYEEPYVYDSAPYEEGYVQGGASPDDVAYCQQRYRSYDIRSGTYLNNDGNRYPCP